MSRKDTILRILIVVGVLYSALLIVMIIFFAMSVSALSGLRLSYENMFGKDKTPVSSPMDETRPAGQEDMNWDDTENGDENTDELPVSIPIADDMVE